MELLSQDDIIRIAKNCGEFNIINWSVKGLSEKLSGYLGEHLKLVVNVECNGTVTNLNLFIKCIPRHDEWKANYIRELGFFRKEYVMLSQLFQAFGGDEGFRKWRPRVLFLKEDLFVFEDVTCSGYSMPHFLNTLKYDETIATVEAIARFHAQSYIYEERKTVTLNRPYRIWDDYREFLEEPDKGHHWRNAGRNAMIDFLKVHSSHKKTPGFTEKLESIVFNLFETALALMKPSDKHRNVVVHRDLWTNNIFLKKFDDGKVHAQIIDFQTVLYCSPMIDLSSLLYFNTTRSFRQRYLDDIIDIYYNILLEEFDTANVSAVNFLDRKSLGKSYKECLVFGMTQAAIIVPITVLTSEDRDRIFGDPASCHKVNEVSRSQEFLDVAETDDVYKQRVLELFDEIVETFVYPANTEIINQTTVNTAQ